MLFLGARCSEPPYAEPTREPVEVDQTEEEDEGS